MTLTEAIEQQIRLGSKDPIVIARDVKSLYGEDWVASQLLQQDDEIVAELARRSLGARRRSAEGHVAADLSRPSGELLIQAKWVPDVGWKRLADLTAGDCRAVAEHYAMLSRVAGVRAGLFSQWADLIEAEGVDTLGEVTVALPLPELEAAS